MLTFSASTLLIVALGILGQREIVDAQSVEPNVNSRTIAASDPSLVVNLGYVQYQGVKKAPLRGELFDEPVKSWYGIRYAASPEGARRWAAPVNIESANNYSASQILDATQIGPGCLNGVPGWASPSASAPGGLPFLPPPNGTSEDCLLLNVHTPQSTLSSARLPVMVQIHGGGYVAGSAETANGELLVSRSKSSIIYIEIQYRLGGLGYLSGSAVRANGAANAGYADQRSALEWVQRNIAAFGGDPTKVTIFGGSAGGGSVAAQMQLFGRIDKPPFRAAIAEYPGLVRHHENSFLENQYNLLLTTANCSNLACLRSLTFEKISAAINRTYITGFQQGMYGYDDNYYQPTVDGNLIRELPSSAFQNGRFSKVPFLSDHNALEGLAFVNASTRTNADIRSFLQKLYPTANDVFLDQVDHLYPVSAFGENYFEQPILQDLNIISPRGLLVRSIIPGLGENYDARNSYYFKEAQIFGDVTILCPSQWLASGVANRSVPTWKLNYNSGLYIHGAVDITALDPVTLLNVSDRNETAALQAYILGFVVDLDPNKGPVALQSQPWPQYGSVGNVLQINQTALYSTAVDPDISARCQFWLDNAATVRS